MEIEKVSGNDQRSDLDFANVVASLEPDQLIAAKTKYHWPRRKLTGAEILLFWALRLYLIFMLGVVIYQIWHAVR